MKQKETLSELLDTLIEEVLEETEIQHLKGSLELYLNESVRSQIIDEYIKEIKGLLE